MSQRGIRGFTEKSRFDTNGAPYLTVGTLDYDITIRTDVCNGYMTAESSVYNVNLTGELTLGVYPVSEGKRKSSSKNNVYTGNVTSCTTLMMYSPYDGSLRSILITWTPIPVSVYDGD